MGGRLSIFLPDKWEHDYNNGEVFRDKIVYVGGATRLTISTTFFPSREGATAVFAPE